MTGRHFYSESEKICLQKLIIKYRLNSRYAVRNPATRRMAWSRLVHDYNSIRSNSKRTEAQLRKCWDNMKTRQKTAISLDSNTPKTELGQQNTEMETQEDGEPQYIIEFEDNDDDQGSEDSMMENTDRIKIKFEENGNVISVEDTDNLDQRPGSRLSGYSIDGLLTPDPKNAQAKAIKNEFHIRQLNYVRQQEREEELHSLIVAQKKWLLKGAQEQYHTMCLERQNAEAILRCNQIKLEIAELELQKSNKSVQENDIK